MLLTMACRLGASPKTIILTGANDGPLHVVANVTLEFERVTILVGGGVLLPIGRDSRIATGELCK